MGLSFRPRTPAPFVFLPLPPQYMPSPTRWLLAKLNLPFIKNPLLPVGAARGGKPAYHRHHYCNTPTYCLLRCPLITITASHGHAPSVVVGSLAAVCALVRDGCNTLTLFHSFLPSFIHSSIYPPHTPIHIHLGGMRGGGCGNGLGEARCQLVAVPTVGGGTGGGREWGRQLEKFPRASWNHRRPPSHQREQPPLSPTFPHLLSRGGLACVFLPGLAMRWGGMKGAC